MSMSYWNTSPGNHAHTCSDCGFTWEHGDDTPDNCVTYLEFLQAHTCKRCGSIQKSKTAPNAARALLRQQAPRYS